MEYYTVLGLVFVVLTVILGFFMSIKKSISDNFAEQYKQKEKEQVKLNDIKMDIREIYLSVETMKENDTKRDERMNRKSKEIDALSKRQEETEKKLLEHGLAIKSLNEWKDSISRH